MATMKDVATLAGVSPITVSRVVNNSGYVGQRTRERVEAAIQELHYVPNRLARNLRSQHSDFLALVLPDITNAFWTSIARGVEDEAWSRGYGVFLCNTDNDPEKEAGYIHRLLQQRVEGVLFVPTPLESSETHLERLMRQNVKCVVVNRRLTTTAADIVRIDGEAATRTLTAELIRAGCRHIAFIGLPSPNTSSEERLHGYKAALQDAGLPVVPELVRASATREESAGHNLVLELLRQDVAIDAIVLANSRLALGGINAIAQAGLRIPDDIMVAAFHDITALDTYAPRLITAVQPSYRMGQLAARRLLELDDSAANGPFREIVLEPTIHIGSQARNGGE